MAGKDLSLAVATATVEAIGSAYGIVGVGAAISPLMRDLLQLQDEQVQSIRRIEQGVQQLITAPWRTARIHLEECALPGRSAKQVKSSLRQAGKKLREALGTQQARSLAAAYIAYDLAIVLALAGDEKASRHYAAMSADVATNAVIGSIRAARAASNSTSGLEAIISEARQTISEARLAFERVSAKVFGPTAAGRAGRGSQLAARQHAQTPPAYWYGIVEGASMLCNRDLVAYQFARLKPWLS